MKRRLACLVTFFGLFLCDFLAYAHVTKSITLGNCDRCTAYCKYRGGMQTCVATKSSGSVTQGNVDVSGTAECTCVDQTSSVTSSFQTCSACNKYCKGLGEIASCSTAKTSGAASEGNVNVSGSIVCVCTPVTE